MTEKVIWNVHGDKDMLFVLTTFNFDKSTLGYFLKATSKHNYFDCFYISYEIESFKVHRILRFCHCEFTLNKKDKKSLSSFKWLKWHLFMLLRLKVKLISSIFIEVDGLIRRRKMKVLSARWMIYRKRLWRKKTLLIPIVRHIRDE